MRVGNIGASAATLWLAAGAAWADGLVIPAPSWPLGDAELRLAGDLHGIKWLVGGYYSWDEVRTNTPGFLTDLFNTDVLITADQKTQTGAIFGQADWPIT